MIIEFASLAGQLVLRERASAAARLAGFLDVLLGPENISELQIAMADALLVRSVERIANLRRELQCLIEVLEWSCYSPKLRPGPCHYAATRS